MSPIFLPVLLKSVSVLTSQRILKARVLSHKTRFWWQSRQEFYFNYWACCQISRNSILTEFLFPEIKHFKLSKQTFFKFVEENPKILKGLLSLCCQCSHLSLYAHLAISEILIKHKQDILDSQNHTFTQQPLWTLLRSVCQLNCHHFIDFSAYL